MSDLGGKGGEWLHECSWCIYCWFHLATPLSVKWAYSYYCTCDAYIPPPSPPYSHIPIIPILSQFVPACYFPIPYYSPLPSFSHPPFFLSPSLSLYFTHPLPLFLSLFSLFLSHSLHILSLSISPSIPHSPPHPHYPSLSLSLASITCKIFQEVCTYT